MILLECLFIQLDVYKEALTRKFVYISLYVFKLKILVTFLAYMCLSD